MFILLSETDLKQQSAVRDAFRSLGAGIDRAVYGLMGLVFQLFFSVASADIFSSGMISKFYTRVQLIIGVFVLFQLAMTVLRGIVNPEGFTDSKSGAGNIVMRICTALVMLAMIVPINIPSASNEFEKQINNNGLLFGTLYSLQHRILSNNTIGKVVMGVGNNKDGETNYMNTKGNAVYKEAANVFTSTIIKGFYRINLIPEEDRKHENGKEDDQINENRVCTDIPDEVINTYKRLDADPSDITDLINTTCNSEGLGSRIVKAVFHPIKTLTEGNGKVYAFTFMPVISSIIGVLFVVILLSFCVDVAMRAIKLAVLRLLAPIPIISYMDPKGGKDGAFGAWTKLLISTYLDLFIRVASVYFVIYMIQEMLVHGITTNSTGALKVFTVLFIWVGLFYFAKEAPKFIKQALGMKDDGGGGLFSGIGKVVGLGAGLGATAAGVVGGGISGAVTGAAAGKTTAGKVMRGIGGGLAGAAGGGVNNGKALLSGDKPDAKAMMAANRARSAKRYANLADDSTAWGRFKAGFQSDFGLQNQKDKLDKKQAHFNAANDAWTRLDAALAGEDQRKFAGTTIGDAFSAGERYTVKEAGDILDAMKSSGKYSAQEMRDANNYVKKLKGQAYEEIIRKPQKDNARDQQVVAAAETIVAMGRQNADYEDFKGFKDVEKAGQLHVDPNDHTKTILDVDYGKLKGAAGSAKREADKIKASPEYAQATANAKRAEESKSK